MYLVTWKIGKFVDSTYVAAKNEKEAKEISLKTQSEATVMDVTGMFSYIEKVNSPAAEIVESAL